MVQVSYFSYDNIHKELKCDSPMVEHNLFLMILSSENDLSFETEVTGSVSAILYIFDDNGKLSYNLFLTKYLYNSCIVAKSCSIFDIIKKRVNSTASALISGIMGISMRKHVANFIIFPSEKASKWFEGSNAAIPSMTFRAS